VTPASSEVILSEILNVTVFQNCIHSNFGQTFLATHATYGLPVGRKIFVIVAHSVGLDNIRLQEKTPHENALEKTLQNQITNCFYSHNL